MGWQDRSYYRDSGSGSHNPLMWLMTGSVPLFTAFGIRVRMHASLLVMVVLVLLFGLGQGFTWQDRVESMAILFGIILIHEFGHCFAARSVGGEAHDILMWPLGGLAMAHAPRRPWPTFVTVAGGPLVNVLICAICGIILYLSGGWVPWNPLWTPYGQWHGWLDIIRYVYWIYSVSWMLLLFNLLPIFPLDGGQLLQSMLWPKFGYYKSMNFACITGMVGAIAGGMVALATFSIMLALLAYSGFVTCLNMRRSLLAAGPWGFQDEDGMDYTASLASSHHDHSKHRKLNKRLLKRAQKREAEERDEQDRVDQILAKVSAHGMNSLTFWEKRALKKATERQRKRDEELHEEMGRKGF
jgi:Zn-dependent protease